MSALARHRWSRNYDACQRCGTDDRPHKARGYCSSCYAMLWSSGDLSNTLIWWDHKVYEEQKQADMAEDASFEEWEREQNEDRRRYDEWLAWHIAEHAQPEKPFDPIASYVVDGLSERIDATNDRRLRKARELILDVAMGTRRRWWRFWR